MLVRNNYPGSPYGHWDYELFKDVKPYHRKGKKLGFLAFIGNTRYVQKGNVLLLYKLVEYYRDLNKVLQRVQDDYHDDMFMRFVFNAKVFGTEERFKDFLQFWDDLFSIALERYLKREHEHYDETYGISYVTYFNTRFSKCLTYSCLDVLLYSNSKAGYPDGFRYSSGLEMVSLTSPSTHLVTSPLEYPKESYYQELIYQSFSPSQEATV